MLYHAVIVPNVFPIETPISVVYTKKLYIYLFLEASYCLASCSSWNISYNTQLLKQR